MNYKIMMNDNLDLEDKRRISEKDTRVTDTPDTHRPTKYCYARVEMFYNS